ncbi:MAG: hypothetical protein WA210_15055 [Burkholderiaceae bacterium]
MSLYRSTWLGLILACGLMLGCAGYSPDSLPARSSLVEATAKLGAPSGEYALPGGGKRLEFVRGPAGLHTYMLDFDAGGSLLSWTQVLYEENFATITLGMGSGDVLVRLGHPAHEFGVWSGRQTIWAYRFDSPQCLWFMVGVSPQGQVASTSYGMDPRCNLGGKQDRD